MTGPVRRDPPEPFGHHPDDAAGSKHAGAAEPIRILMLAANPLITPRRALDVEARAITEKLRLSRDRDAFEFITHGAVRPDDLLQHLNRYRPHIVHFSGHASTAGEITLTTDTGGEHRVSTQALADLFAKMKDNIRVVVLNAGYSAIQAQAIGAHIDYVIGMRASIDDRAATVFAAAFYSALGFRRTVQEAFDQGTAALKLHGLPDHATPELIVRPGAETGPVPTGRPADRQPHWEPLTEPVDVAWRADLDGRFRRAGMPVVEVHLVPVEPRLSVPVTTLRALGDQLDGLGRDAGLFTAGAAPQQRADAAACLVAPARSGASGIAVTWNGQRSAWAPLSRTGRLYTLDEHDVTTQLQDLVEVLTRIPIPTAARIAAVAGVEPATMIAIVEDDGAVRFVPGLPDHIRPAARDWLPARAFTQAPAAVAGELAARLVEGYLLAVARVRPAK